MILLQLSFLFYEKSFDVVKELYYMKVVFILWIIQDYQFKINLLTHISLNPFLSFPCFLGKAYVVQVSFGSYLLWKDLSNNINNRKTNVLIDAIKVWLIALLI